MKHVRIRAQVALVSGFLLLFGAAMSFRAQDAPQLTLPAGATIQVALVRPLMAATAAPGSPVYAQTMFPAVAGGKTAIPPGTYIQGTLEKLTRPTLRSRRADLEILFTQIVYANNYVAVLPGAPGAGENPQAGSGGSLIDVAVQVSAANDVLLDNGAPIEITLDAPLTLDAELVASAIPLSHAPDPGNFKSASMCRYIPGYPGTPGTPDTVIPGTPATPGTVIPGDPGTPGWPGVYCPAPPMVLSSKPVNPPNSPNQSISNQPRLPAAAH